ncbi:siderophore-interacting protein [Pimelobacter sp. 30-1]|uniref:siderophore-interacting protein n=1 Tax=Pimelobacter sp. 30-1 TaxID=2004991 RepID=UPI0027E31698|nr:siderophore-interacting protein [Pimelobacter sp. 30-1]
MIGQRDRPAERVAEHHGTGRGMQRIGYPIGICRTTVARRELVTPRMLRLTLTGDELAGFHSYVADDHVKIVFPHADGTRTDPVPNDRQLLDWPKPLPPTRTYTIRRVDLAAREVDLDVVLHAGGLAGDWAEAVAIGDPAVIAGPPGAKAFAHTHRHYVLAVDVTGLPAVARWLDEADWLEAAGATAHVLVEHDHADETGYPLQERAGVEVRWLSRAAGSQLGTQVRALDVPDDTFVFGAGEAEDLKEVRRWVAERELPASITGYWKRGVAGLDD